MSRASTLGGQNGLAARFIRPACERIEQRLRNKHAEGERLVISFFGIIRLIACPSESRAAVQASQPAQTGGSR